MRRFLTRIYARKHLGRALAATGSLIILLGYTGWLIPEASNIPALMVIASIGTFFTFPAALLILSTPFIGLATMRANRRRENGETPETIPLTPTTPARKHLKRYLGRYIALAGILTVFSPAIPVLLFANTMTEGPESNIYWWHLFFTIPVGGTIAAVGAIRGIIAMTRNQNQ